MISKPIIKVAFVAVVLSVLLLGSSAFAQQAPAAGTTIGNQASATYTDGSAVQRTATSNLVVTTVQQVAGFTLTTDGQTKTATPGAQVIYTHVLTNTGNGSDTFTIGLSAGGAATPTNIAVYMDANNDGIPDNSVNLVGTGTVPLAAGASVHLLVVGTVPASATSGQAGTLAITAKSVFDGTVPLVTNTDTTTVTGNAVVNLTKSLSAVSGASPSGPYTVTLTYTNNGNATATNVTIGDALPGGMTYVAGSGLWSVTGATALFENGTQQPASGSPNIKYTVTGNTISAVINSIPAQTSGTLTFKVNIASGLAPGAINNIATISYNDGTANVGPFNSNIATFTVNQTPGVTMSDTGTSATGDSDNTVNNVQLVASATQGATVTFNNVVKNTGNGTDTFNISVVNNSFPAGTTFVLYKSDGVTPLTDSNADGVSDTGPLAAGASYTVVVKATLPASASGGGPYNATATATSTFSSATSANVTERLTTITANTVDLTNNSPAGTGVPGNGIFPTGEATAQVTNPVNPGATTVFTLYVNNTSTTADSYDVLVSTSSTFSGNTLPSGWTISFQNSGNGTDCTSLGATITNTGVVNAAGNKIVCAVIGVPAGYAAGTQQIFFRALSSTSNAFDVLHDAVTVNTVHSVTLTPNNTGQIFPGGSVVYVHTLKNNGNVTETVTFSGTWIADNQSLWSSTLYTDNGSLANQLDATDTPVSSGGNNSFSLAPGASMVMLVKVIAPPSAAAGAVDTTTVTATYNSGGTTATANDQSTVIAGDLRLNKLQATSSGCNGTPDAAFSAATLSAKPGACLVYQITAQNQGTANVSSVVVSDATPTNTTYFDNAGAFKAATTVGSVTNPTSGSAGTVTATVGTLTPGQSAVITFMVKIN